MSNVASPAVITQSISTLPEAPAPEAAPAAETNPAPPGKESESGAASGAGAPAPKGPDRNLEIARRFEAVAQRESRAQRLEREAKAKATEIAEREKKLADKERELDEALGDPVGHMLKKGVDPVKVAQRYAKPETEEEKRIRRLEEREEQREADAKAAEENRKKAQEKWEAEQHEKHRMDVTREFVSSITAKECPNLTALYEAKEVPRLVDNLLQSKADPSDPRSPTMIQAFVRQYRRNPTNQEIREALEHEATERATKILTAAAAGRAQADSESPEQGSAKPGRGPSGISNQHAAVTQSGKKRPPTIEEKRKQTRKNLTAALEAEGEDEKR